MRKYYIYIGVLGAVVLALVIESFSLMGNPWQQKMETEDANILNDFSTLKNQIDTYYGKNYRLPETLTVLPNYSYSSKDYSKYQYQPSTDRTYNLCATFATDTRSIKPTSSPYYTNIYELGTTSTRHAKGFACISYKVSSYLYNTPTPRLSPTPILTPLEAQKLFFEASCSGQMINKMCVYPGCMYNYPISLYVQGGAADSYGNTYTDYCTNNKTSVAKYYCKQTGQTNSYYNSTRIFDCPNGCVDGKCIK